MDEREKLKRNLRTALVGAFVCLIVAVYCFVRASEGSDDWRYGWYSDYTNKIKMIRFFGWLALSGAEFDIVCVYFRSVRLGEMNKAVFQTCPDCGKAISRNGKTVRAAGMRQWGMSVLRDA